MTSDFPQQQPAYRDAFFKSASEPQHGQKAAKPEGAKPAPTQTRKPAH